MTNQAKVTSIEALELFRASLIVFLAKARRSLDDASEDVRRTRQWLQNDQRMNLEGEYRRKMKQLEQARQELMSVRLGAAAHQESALMARQMAVAKAQREVEEVERKLRKLKSWNQNYDSSADAIVKRMDRLRQSLDELPKAIAYLAGVQRALDAYAESSDSVPSAPVENTAPAATNPEPEAQAP